MDNPLDFDLAKSVVECFRLNEQQMDVILKEVIGKIFLSIEILRNEIEMLNKAFKCGKTLRTIRLQKIDYQIHPD